MVARMRSLGFKVFVGVTLIIGVSTAFLVVVLTERERERVTGAKEQAGSMVADLLAGSLAAPLDFDDIDATKTELEDLRRSADIVYAAAYSPDGALIAESGVSPRAPGDLRVRTTVTADDVELVRPVQREGRTLGSARVVLSLAEENRQFALTRTLILEWGLGLGFASALLLVLFIQRGIVAPLRTLADAVRSVEAGADATVAAKGKDEVGELARAFNAMSAAVRDREERLREARTRVEHLLDHMRQSIVVLDATLVPTGFASRAARELFGEDLEGGDLGDMLYADAPTWHAERQAFDAWRALVVETAGSDRADVLALAPREARCEQAGRLRVLELEFVALAAPEGYLMLLATDVTDHRALLRETEREAREIEALRYLIGNAHVLGSFLTRARERVELCRGAGADAQLASSPIDALQHLHTIKGEALALGLEEVASAARAIEATLAPSVGSGGSPRALDLDLSALVAALDAAEQRFVDLSPDGRDGLSKVPVDRRDLLRLVELLEQSGAPRESRDLAQRLAARPLGELASSLVAKAPSWAEADGKEVRVEVEGERSLLPSELSEVLPGVLTHVVRNAIAHGLESTEERERAAKPRIGVIRVRARGDDGTESIEVDNDGRAIDPDASAALFDAGVTTARERTDLAGLGVGLSAARADLAQIGWTIRFGDPPEGGGVRLIIEKRERASVSGTTWKATKARSSS